MIVILGISILTVTVFVYLKSIFLPKLKSLTDKHVVITGGSSGIGKSVAIEAAKQGAHVTILARDKAKLEAAKHEIIKFINPAKQKIQAVSLDVTQFTQVEQTLKEIDEKLPVFMLVNCAGMAICGTLEDLSVTDINKLVNLNLYGTIYPTKCLIPSMKARNEGIIVITASQAAFLGIFGLSLYSSTKYALRGLSEALDMELRPYNISVTLSLPPDTDTPGLENENKSKPMETHLISETAGLFHPDEVGKKLIHDSLAGKFYSTIGFESFMLSTLCCGMTPFTTFAEVLVQTFLLGPFRLISSFYILKFQRIVKDCKSKTN